MGSTFPHPAPAAPEAPHFLVGRERRAGWVVIETHGLCGGLFCDEAAALRYAKEASGGRQEAIEMAHGPLVFQISGVVQRRKAVNSA